MRYLFGPEGGVALRALLERPALFAFDFDGTLAPIVTDPAHARPSRAITRLMTALGSRAPVAVISGRRIADLEARLGFMPDWLVGNHGGEGLPVDLEQRARWQRLSDGWLRQLQERVPPALLAGGAWIEDKRLSLTLHYRLVRNPVAVAATLRALAASLEPPPRVVGGKYVLNLLPADSPDKLDALRFLVGRLQVSTALFVGDDDTDEDVFARAPADWLTVRVEASGASAARFFVHDQREVGRLLLAVLRSGALPAVRDGPRSS